MNVFESSAGHDFVTHLMPRLVSAIEKMAESVPSKLPLSEMPVQLNQNVLKDLYTGYFCPGEETGVSQKERYRNLSSTLHDLAADLKSKLGEEHWLIVEKYCTAMSDRDGEELAACFEAGFRAATQLLIAGLSTKEESADEL